MAARASLDTIEDFLAQKRIATVGVSRQSKDFSVMLFDELCRRRYDMVPVNPNASEIRGHRCFARVQDVQPVVDGAILMTSPAVSETVVRGCAQAGIRGIWMYRAGGEGAVNAKAIAFCREKGIEVVPGECPFMFLPRAGFHRMHGLIRKIRGSYPRRSRSAAPGSC